MSYTEPRRVVPAFSEKDVADMLKLIELSPFPSRPPIPSKTPWELGIDYDYLKSLKDQFTTSWSAKSLEERIQKMDHLIVTFDLAPGQLDLHYVHAKSPRADAIPLLLLHGWPGTFFDFHKVIDELTNPSQDDHPAFHVVVPSLPGYFLSSYPYIDSWDINKSAEYIHKLMVEVLGYKKYAGQGGDWGSFVLRIIGALYPTEAPVIHFNMFWNLSGIPVESQTLSEAEKSLVLHRNEFADTGHGYEEIQRTKPFTIGIAIGASPLAMLTYIGDKMYAWSDPTRLKAQDILDTVAIYYLTRSFATSVIVYNQSTFLRKAMLEPKRLTIKIGYSAFPYEIGGSTRAEIESAGRLVYYKDHKHGGHFPALDSSEEYIQDLREFFGLQWEF